MATPKTGLQLFGGDWTERKLEVLGKYLHSYATALKNQPFEKYYIDAFAGTGYRELRKKPSFPEYMYVFDDGLDEPEPQDFLDGSATIALRVEPHFDRYIFIESQQRRVKELEKLKTVFSVTGSKNRRAPQGCKRRATTDLRKLEQEGPARCTILGSIRPAGRLEDGRSGRQNEKP